MNVSKWFARYLGLLLCVAPMAWAGEEPIKAFSIDFNWGPGGDNAFAGPGHWADAEPAAHVAWYEGLGVNTIQTFAVSCNGYAWYKNGKVPEQPGLKHDFLPEMVRLGHERGMRVMAYFCVGANTRWSKEHPEQSYGAEADFNLIMTDEYLDYLTMAIEEAITLTGIDGFMIDWVWNPFRARESQAQGKWMDAEKALFEQVMGIPFPGEDNLADEQYLAYSRKNIERVWTRIRNAAKSAKPDCIIWLSCFDVSHPSVVDSLMFREVDWLMNEDPHPEKLKAPQDAGTPRQRLLQCLVGWGDQHDAYAAVTNPDSPTRDFYGFSKPGPSSLPLPIARYRSQPIDAFEGNDKNIATLVRYFNGELDAPEDAPPQTRN
ncbi:MAG: hypothetical protein JXR94_01725 [Candidatus Hydrogenedentes bacterium]|nr:hypothetical protein [Candidatus Hydrogenedentota bacterium]